MNVIQEHTTVTLTHTVQTLKVPSTVRVNMVTLVMESRVLVSKLNYSRNLNCVFDLTFCFNFFEDITECDERSLAPHHANYSHNCHDDANCTNTKGSFYCSCHVGYSGDGVICTGIVSLHLNNLQYRECWRRIIVKNCPLPSFPLRLGRA